MPVLQAGCHWFESSTAHQIFSVNAQGKEAFLIISIDEFNQEIIYSYCRMKPADYRINIGGLEAGIGIGYEF